MHTPFSAHITLQSRVFNFLNAAVIHIYVYIHMHTYIHLSVSISIYLYIYIYIYIYTHVYTYIYIMASTNDSRVVLYYTMICADDVQPRIPMPLI